MKLLYCFRPRRTSLGLAIVLLFYCLLAMPVHAQNFGMQEAGKAATYGGYGEGTTETTFSETLGVTIKLALSLVGAIFLALMVYAGYLWMTARGEEEPINKAKKIIIAAIVGLVITVGAYSVTDYVLVRIFSAVNEASQKK